MTLPTPPAGLSPPEQPPRTGTQDWLPVPSSDPLINHLETHLWDQAGPPMGWEAARSSQAVYLYREIAARKTLVAKFYHAKTGKEAQKYALRERQALNRVRRAGLATGPIRAVAPLGVWQGVLFLEHIPGLTLEDCIAVRRSRPGTLAPSLEAVGRLLAALHERSVRPQARPDIRPARAQGRKILGNLARHGVLQRDPITQRGLEALIEGWTARTDLAAYTPTLIHGDATSTNFIFPEGSGGVVAIDWERCEAGDPAADLGRVMAEVIHSLERHGGDVEEALPLADLLAETYLAQLPTAWDLEAIGQRGRFYQALSTLRIARNGWLSRLTRTALVARGMALLSADPSG